MEKSTVFKGERKRSFSQWVKNLSTHKKLIVAICLIIFVLSLEMGNFYLGIKIMSGIRSWVGGEDYWSHQQKTAHYILQEYVISHNEAEYDQIPNYLNAYIGDRNARIEMGKPIMNYAYVTRQFVFGGINAGDTDDTIFLFRYFRYTPWVSEAVTYWEDADIRVQTFITISQQIHALVVSPINSNDAGAQKQRDAQIALLIQEENISDNKAALDENNFAEVLGEGSRAIKVILLAEAGFFNIILAVLAISISVFIAKITIQMENEKNDFMRIANHQLNTPLSIMKNAYTMIENGSLDAREGLAYIGSGLARMMAVFEDVKIVLDFEGQAKHDVRENDIQSAMEEAVKYEQDAITTNKKNIHLIIEDPGFNIPKVVCDIKQLNNAIYNLLDNAVHYTDQGIIIVSYEIIGNTYVKVNIKDTGMGFSLEDKEKFGQKFYRSKKALLEHPDGSGLGLYICKKIIENNKGQLFFESAGEGKGSIFSFTIPIAK